MPRARDIRIVAGPVASGFTTARRFDNGGYASINDTAALRSPTTAVTVAGWVKVLGVADTNAALVMKQYATSSPWLSYAIQAQGAGVGEFKFRISDGATGYATGNLSSALTTDVWAYLAARWESGGLMTLDWFNAAGTLVEQVDSTTAVTATIGYANFPLVFGVDAVAPVNGVPCDLAGWLVDNVRLSDGQLTTHRNGTFPQAASAGMWRFGVSDPETDASGNGLALALSEEELQVVAGPDDGTVPVVTSVGSSSVGASFATVTWTTDENTDSTVEYGLTTGYGSSVADAALKTTHAVQVTGLTASTEYHFRVRSADTNGNETVSADGTFTTSAAAVPSAPTGVSATPDDGQVAVGWMAVSGADTYTVYRSLTSGSGFSSVQSGITGTSWIDGGRTNDVTYYYKVTATNTTGESADSAEVSATPTAVGAITHGSQLTPANVGLRGVGYTYDSGTDTFTHATYGDLTVVNGNYEVSADDEVIEGLEIRGRVDCNTYDNVIMRRCRVKMTGNNVRAVFANDGYGLTVEDCDIEHVGPLEDAATSEGIYSSPGGLTIRRNNIHRFQIGIQHYGGDTLIEENIVWDPHKVSGTHGNASSYRGEGPCIYRRNYMVGNSSACIAFYAIINPMDQIDLIDNYFTAVDLVAWGASSLGTPSYLVNCGAKPGASGNTNWLFSGNIFFRTEAGAGGDWPNGGQYGAVQNGGSMQTWPGSVSTNNLWNDGATAFGDFGPV